MARQRWFHRFWFKARRQPVDEPMVPEKHPESEAYTGTLSGEQRTPLGGVTGRADEQESPPQILTSEQLQGDPEPDFETFVEDPDALSAESKSLLDDDGRPNLGVEGARQDEGDPLDKIGDGFRPDIGGGHDVGDPFDRGLPGEKGDELAGIDPGDLGMDPRLAEPALGGGLGFLADSAARTSELSQQFGGDALSEDRLDMLGKLKAGDIPGSDPTSARARAETVQQIGGTPDPADQKIVDESPGPLEERPLPPIPDPPEDPPEDPPDPPEDPPEDPPDPPPPPPPPPDPETTPDPEDPDGGPKPMGGQPAIPGLPKHSPEVDLFDTLIQPPDGEDTSPPPEAVAERLDPSLEARQAGFTDPHPGDGESSGGDDDEPFDMPGTLIDPPEMLDGGALGGIDEPPDREPPGGPVVGNGGDDTEMEELP